MAESADTHGALQKLLIQASLGDKDALGRLLDLHRGFLRSLAQRVLSGRLNARLDASDLVQETCLSAYRSFQEFQGREVTKFVAWIRGIHERNLIDAIRKQVQAAGRAVEREQPLVAPWDQEIAASQEPSPSGRAMANEQAVILTLAMEKLPEDQREAVRLRHLEGRPLAEIADRLGRTETAVAGLLKRGMRSLRKWFKDDERGTP